jgi:site-specific recombinase XerD
VSIFDPVLWTPEPMQIVDKKIITNIFVLIFFVNLSHKSVSKKVKIMKTQTSILFYLRKSRENKKGEAPVYMRVTVEGNRIDLTTNRFIHPDKWSTEAAAMKGNSEEARTFNTYLSTLKNKVLKHINNLEIQGVEITADTLKALMIGAPQNKKSLVEVFRYHNKRLESLIGKGYAIATYKKYVYTLGKLEAYIGHTYSKSDILLTNLNHAFITGFEFYLRTNNKLDTNTTMKYIKNLKKVVREAIANEWLDRDPFARFKCTHKESSRTFLSQQELDAIIKKEFTIPRLSQVRDIFVFSCYTGLAYSDIEKLTPDDVRLGIDGEKWITINRRKTDTRSSIPLLPQALQIVERYKDDPVANNSGKLLPVISNQKMNAFLKEIATLCYVNKNLTYHMARHTFATTVTLTNGVPIETVSKMLGHTNIKTTQIYSKVVDSKVSQDMRNLKNILNPKPDKQSLAI